MAINMDGRAFADKMIDEIIVKAKCCSKKPGLAVIIIGDKASRTYANGKRKDCEKCGFHYEEYILPEGTPERHVANLIYKLDDDPNITGIIVEMPLPTWFSKSTLLAIRPDKDIDCLSPYNNGMMEDGSVTFPPCTPEAVIELMDHYGINMSGSHCVVIGRSDVVGKPLANMLLNRDATVTVCHSKTKDLASICRSADIILSAVGKPNLITADMVSDGAVVIDVAINRDPITGKLCGDVDYGEVEKKTSYITPVPGGIGPVTRVMLLRHLLYSGGIIGYGDI